MTGIDELGKASIIIMVLITESCHTALAINNRESIAVYGR
jgi:hypothetical protein